MLVVESDVSISIATGFNFCHSCDANNTGSANNSVPVIMIGFVWIIPEFENPNPDPWVIKMRIHQKRMIRRR